MGVESVPNWPFSEILIMSTFEILTINMKRASGSELRMVGAPQFLSKMHPTGTFQVIGNSALAIQRPSSVLHLHEVIPDSCKNRICSVHEK
jgi:hypothetical protein